MKKIEFYLITLFFALSLNSSMAVGSTLNGTKVVSDEDIEWLEGEDVVSTSKFIQQTLVLDPEKLAEVDNLDLHSTLLRTSGLRKISQNLLPYLPNLKFLNLFVSDLGSDEDLETLASILERFHTLQYVDIIGNNIADRVFSYVKAHEGQKELTDRFQNKVVFSFKTLLESQFPIAGREHYNDWYQTHIRYYSTNYYLSTLPY
ncbi:MAG: hypothetical protein K2X02_04825 [Alphaproteobacteria bacterium]|nr:hypothetical protein [Alphaproteobacteria bacterium]